MTPTDEPLRDFADRFFRDALRRPENLRDFLMDAVPKLAAGFDFERVKEVDPDFLLPDWRRREADLLFEIPYRSGTEECVALVCVLIEHQTKADPRMPLRTLLEIALYWDRQWRTWDKETPQEKPFRLNPVLPIVLHTGAHAWDRRDRWPTCLARRKPFTTSHRYGGRIFGSCRSILPNNC